MTRRELTARANALVRALAALGRSGLYREVKLAPSRDAGWGRLHQVQLAAERVLADVTGGGTVDPTVGEAVRPQDLFLDTHTDLQESEDPEGLPSCRAGFYVVATAPDGRRWRHSKTFWATDYRSGSRRADRVAAQLLEEVQAAAEAGTWEGPVGNPNWTEVRPAYGSEAYDRGEWSRRDAGDERALDMEDDGTYRHPGGA